MRKLSLIICFIAIFMSGCSSKLHYSSSKELVSYFENAGYTVDEFSEIGEIGGITRIVATKDKSIIDVCYQVKDKDCETIIEYYNDYYEDAYITGFNGGKGIVYYASDEITWEISKFRSDIQVKPIIVKE